MLGFLDLDIPAPPQQAVERRARDGMNTTAVLMRVRCCTSNPANLTWLRALAPETFRSAELREAHFALCFFCRALSTKWCGGPIRWRIHIAYEQLISG